MIPTHVFSFNGRNHTELQPRDGTVDDRLVDLLSRLNGTERYSLILWKLPQGLRLFDVEVDKGSQEYIQTAGDFNGRMTAEVREIIDGTPHHYVIGRATHHQADTEAADEIVPWNGYEARVRPNEVLSGDEVSDLFVSYYRCGELPGAYTRRRIQL